MSIIKCRQLRYIFEATPTGTHWYHSHVGLQRSKGLFGALIVKEDSAPDYLNIGEFEDKPDEHTLVITENGIVAAKSEPRENLCYEDGSRVASQISSFVPVVNGIELAGKTQKTFYVDYGKTYRFRLIGAMAGTAYQFSIDSHKLIVVATDGYLVKRFETDYIIFHTGERYDFLLDATETSSKSYPIRIELLTINCDSKMKRKAIVGIALLTYNYSPYSSSDAIFKYSNSRCNEKKKCTVFNCPFKAYADGVPKTCHHVDELELVDETPEDEVPDSDNIDLKRTLFFDFGSKLTVNNKHFEIPHIALQVSSYTGKINECNHDTDCSTSDNPKCVHIVDIGKQFYKKGMRFVLSSLGDMSRAIFTHPIHLHGHSFHVVKIGYPSYTSEGIIKDITQDLQRSECGGPPSWKNGVPEIMAATEETVRKDTIMVPAGGYVVIEFLADNPGYWFFHCHIEPHLHRGMAAVIRETKACQNQDIPSGLRESDKNFCWTVEDFIRQKMLKNPCEAALDDPATLPDQSKSDKPLPKERQAELEKKVINRRKNLESMTEKDAILKDQPVKSKINFNPYLAIWPHFCRNNN